MNGKAIKRSHRIACYPVVEEPRIRRVMNTETGQPEFRKVMVRRRRPVADALPLKVFARARNIGSAWFDNKRETG